MLRHIFPNSDRFSGNIKYTNVNFIINLNSIKWFLRIFSNGFSTIVPSCRSSAVTDDSIPTFYLIIPFKVMLSILDSTLSNFSKMNSYF